MAKAVFIAEKPSVAREFMNALHLKNIQNKDGYYESENTIITWCFGHLVTMSYPDAYDEKWKKWQIEPLPFLPREYKYQVVESARKQFQIVSGLLNREDVDTIYICTDSGREGEYIYRLVDQEAHVQNKTRKRVWINSQTEEEIRRGIKDALDYSAYDNLSASAYLRAKEDYLMGINFSRILTLKYGFTISNYLNEKKPAVISVGRVMTCVLGIVVRREREIRSFVKTPFYRILGNMDLFGVETKGEWKVTEKSSYYLGKDALHPKLYKENGFKVREDAVSFIEDLYQCSGNPANVIESTSDVNASGRNALAGETSGGGISQGSIRGRVESISKKKEAKNPPLLFNLAELQSECSKRFKINPDKTLSIIQELYEKKLVTYPRTDARVLSTAVAKEIDKNLRGLQNFAPMAPFVREVLEKESYKGLEKTRYVDDKAITDHYAVIPTGQGLNNIPKLGELQYKIYEFICRRFLAIFYPPAQYRKVGLEAAIGQESFFANFKVLADEGYLKVYSFPKAKKADDKDANAKNGTEEKNEAEEENDLTADVDFLEQLSKLKKGDEITFHGFEIKEGETSPPKRYTSGSMIITMENAGQFIEDEELRAQIKGAGIGTSATRGEILKKLVNNRYIAENGKTQVLTPTMLGEMIYDVVNCSIPSLLNAELTASWEKGLSYVAEGSVSSEEYMQKLEDFVRLRTEKVKGLSNQRQLAMFFQKTDADRKAANSK